MSLDAYGELPTDLDDGGVYALGKLKKPYRNL